MKKEYGGGQLRQSLFKLNNHRICCHRFPVHCQESEIGTKVTFWGRPNNHIRQFFKLLFGTTSNFVQKGSRCDRTAYGSSERTKPSRRNPQKGTGSSIILKNSIILKKEQVLHDDLYWHRFTGAPKKWWWLWLFEKDLNWDTVKKKITEAKISNALSSVKFEVFGMCSVFWIAYLIFENSFLLTQSGTKIYWNTKLAVILCPKTSWYNWGEWNKLYSAKIARRGWLFTGEIAEIADWDFWLRLLRLFGEGGYPQVFTTITTNNEIHL